MGLENQSSSLTAQFYSHDDPALKDATQHPFLEQAGKDTLPAPTLCTWLVQDKYYQLAYVNFIGGLLAKVPLTSCAFPHSDEENLLELQVLGVTRCRPRPTRLRVQQPTLWLTATLYD
jgi:TENA/THI-4/PQQC family